MHERRNDPEMRPGSISLAIEHTAQQRALAKQLLEAVLFSSGAAMTLEELCRPLQRLGSVPLEWVTSLLRELSEELTLRNSAIELSEVGGGFLLRTRAHLAPYLQEKEPRGQRLSPAQLEVLAIVAYRQPTTRSQVEAVRGVDCSHALAALVEKGLVESTGRSTQPGRPALYATTRFFLEHFGLHSLADLQAFLPTEPAPEDGAHAPAAAPNPFPLPQRTLGP